MSVPRSSLVSPHKFKPHRRASFDPTDSVGLSSHCLAGWESSKPTVIPMPSSLDLRTSLHKSRTTLVCPYLSYVLRSYKYSVYCTCNEVDIENILVVCRQSLFYISCIVQLYLSIKFGHCVVIKGKAL